MRRRVTGSDQEKANHPVAEMAVNEETPLARFLATGKGSTHRLDDLLSHVENAAKADSDLERRLRLWLADCAAGVLPRFEDLYPTDYGPRTAIMVARQGRPEVDMRLVESVALSANTVNNAAANAAWAALAAILYRPEQPVWIRLGRSASLNAAGPEGSRYRAAENTRHVQRLFVHFADKRNVHSTGQLDVEGNLPKESAGVREREADTTD